MILYGHNGAVTCLDLHGDKFVSGAKDHLVKGAVVLPVHLCPDQDWNTTDGLSRPED